MSRAHEPFISRRRFRTYSNKLARLDGPIAGLCRVPGLMSLDWLIRRRIFSDGSPQ